MLLRPVLSLWLLCQRTIGPTGRQAGRQTDRGRDEWKDRLCPMIKQTERQAYRQLMRMTKERDSGTDTALRSVVRPSFRSFEPRSPLSSEGHHVITSNKKFFSQKMTNKFLSKKRHDEERKTRGPDSCSRSMHPNNRGYEPWRDLPLDRDSEPPARPRVKLPFFSAGKSAAKRRTCLRTVLIFSVSTDRRTCRL